MDSCEFTCNFRESGCAEVLPQSWIPHLRPCEVLGALIRKEGETGERGHAEMWRPEVRRSLSRGSPPRIARTFCDSATLAPDLGSDKSSAGQLSWGYCTQTLRSITKENSFVLS